jgi:hypothetical protein
LSDMAAVAVLESVVLFVLFARIGL